MVARKERKPNVLLRIERKNTLVATLKHATSPTDVVADEFLAQSTASITACWHLLKGKGINAVSEVLP